VKCKHILAALGCALLALTTVGCGAFKGDTNHLQSITLDVSLINGVPPTGQSGFVTLVGNGGTIQLQPMGNYGGGVAKDLTRMATFNVSVDPLADVDAFDNPLLQPCFGPCPNPFDGVHGTVEWDATGLVTAVEPAVCTFVDTAPLDPVTGKPVTPSWAYTGDYVVTATYAGVTSQPVYIPVASSTGNPFYGGQENNPNAYCDSGSY
jgi:hypothetical protein